MLGSISKLLGSAALVVFSAGNVNIIVTVRGKASNKEPVQIQ